MARSGRPHCIAVWRRLSDGFVNWTLGFEPRAYTDAGTGERVEYRVLWRGYDMVEGARQLKAAKEETWTPC